MRKVIVLIHVLILLVHVTNAYASTEWDGFIDGVEEKVSTDGRFRTWSAEEKAEYCCLAAQYGPYEELYLGSLLLDIPNEYWSPSFLIRYNKYPLQEEAQSIAQEALQQRYPQAAQEMSSATLCAALISYTDEMEMLWWFEWDCPEVPATYWARIAIGDGAVLDAERFDGVAVKEAQFYDEMAVAPRIPEIKAIRIAQTAFEKAKPFEDYVLLIQLRSDISMGLVYEVIFSDKAEYHHEGEENGSYTWYVVDVQALCGHIMREYLTGGGNG